MFIRQTYANPKSDVFAIVYGSRQASFIISISSKYLTGRFSPQETSVRVFVQHPLSLTSHTYNFEKGTQSWRVYLSNCTCPGISTMWPWCVLYHNARLFCYPDRFFYALVRVDHVLCGKFSHQIAPGLVLTKIFAALLSFRMSCQPGYQRVPAFAVSTLLISDSLSPNLSILRCRWLPLITALWGIVMTLMGLVKSYPQLVGARICLGVCEAGLFPGVVYL